MSARLKLRVIGRSEVLPKPILERAASDLGFELEFALVDSVKGDAVFRPAMFPGLEIPLKEVWPTEFENRTDE